MPAETYFENKSSGEPVCGNSLPKRCSDLFDELYTLTKTKEYLSKLHLELSGRFPKIFKNWKFDKAEGKLNSNFLAEHALQLISHIKKEIQIHETVLTNWVCYDLHGFVNQKTARFIAGKNNDKAYRRLRAYLKPGGEKPRHFDCGADLGILCSKLLEQSYSIDHMKGLVLLFYKKYRTKLPELYENWPIDTKTGLIKDSWLTNCAEGLYAWIKMEILKTEKNNPRYKLFNFNYIIFLKARSFILKEYEDLVSPSFGVVNDKVINFLRYHLQMPGLTYDDLLILYKNPNSKTAEEIREKLNEIPGLRHCSFTMKTEKGKRQLYIVLTPKQKEIFIRWITTGGVTDEIQTPYPETHPRQENGHSESTQDYYIDSKTKLPF